MDNLETYLFNLVYRDNSNASAYVVESFIKTRASIIYRHKTDSLDGPGPMILVPVPYERFFSVIFRYFWVDFHMYDTGQLGCTKSGEP